MTSRYSPWYHDIFHDITIYSTKSRHILWHHDIFPNITIYSMTSRYIPWHLGIVMISRYIPWHHDIFHDITIYSLTSRYIPLTHNIFHDIKIYSLCIYDLNRNTVLPSCFPFKLPFNFVSSVPVYFRDAMSSDFFKSFALFLSKRGLFLQKESTSHKMLVDIWSFHGDGYSDSILLGYDAL
jgi:hypothetical protein